MEKPKHKRKIIAIDRAKCNGCGLCARACHEGAIGMVDGKAALLRDDYCDGLGDCLPACPIRAISFVEREADAYDEAAVLANKAAKSSAQSSGIAPEIHHPSTGEASTHTIAAPHHGCPGTHMRVLANTQQPNAHPTVQTAADPPSALGQFPIQIRLVPVSAPWFDGADVLVAADCTAYAYAGMHERFLRGRVTLIGCPKLDAVDYAEKLTAILQKNRIHSLTIVRMEVPCCGGLENACKTAIRLSGKTLPLSVVTISTDGRIL